MEIRYASTDDIKEILVMVNSDREGRSLIGSDGYLESLTQGHFNPLFVAVVDGAIVGFISSDVTTQYRQICIKKLYVRIDNRGKGVGTALINRVKGEVLDRGFDSLQSYIYEYNNESIKLHEKCGFELDGYSGHGKRFSGKRSKLLIYHIEVHG